MKTNTLNTNLQSYLVLLLFLCFGISALNAQTPDLRNCGYNCTANSFSIESVYLSSTNVPGTPLTNTSCEPGTIQNVYMIAGVSSNRNAPVYGARVFADLMVGDTPVPINEYLGTLPSSNQGITEYLVYGPFNWVCGELLTLENLLVVWVTSKNSAPPENGPYTCSSYSQSQCQFPLDLIVSTPLAVQYDYTACTTGSTSLVTFTSTTIGGTPPYTYVWNYDGGTYQGGSASSPIVLYNIPGTYNPTLKVTDSNGNTNLNPYSETLAFPSQLTNTPSSTNPSCTANNGSGSFTASGGTPPYTFTVTANTTGASTSMNGPPTTVLSYSGAGPGTITVRITDDAGCTATESITVTAGDTQAPVVAGSITPTTIEGCNASAAPAAQTTVAGLEALPGNLTITDNVSADANITVNSSDSVSGTCPIVITRTYTVTDECGNTSVSFTHIINIDDSTPPSINTPASNLQVECDGSGNTTALNNWLASHGGANASDTCSTVTWSYNLDSTVNNCGGTQVLNYTFSAADDCNNISTTSATFTIVDTTPPSITAPADVTIECTDDESSANTGVATGSDTCGTVTITESDVETAACGNTKTITRTWTATDECGNASTAVQTITVVDTTPPSITAPADVTIECTDDESSANTGVATGSDTCGTVTITESDVETAACGNTKTITRTWTATDECGNASTAVQTITVVDTTPPSITAPADVTIECTDDESSANTGVATGSDTCGTVTITESDVETAACGNTKTITRTWTATDECGNASTAVQTITVVDTTPPSITAPADITIECTDDESSANTGVATGSDTCGTVTITESDVETAACGNTKTITRTWTATDECGNASTAVQTITVVDTTPPSITAPADVTIECTDDESSANTGVATGSDTCGTVTITESDVETAACGNTKTITRTWTATDECGNASTAVQTITVVDTTPPSITAPADVTIECTDDESSANTGVATGSDTCGTVTITESDVETAACGNTKTITRTWTATDECGNASTAVQTITVVDTTPPSITAPADITIECTDDESSANTGVATGSDTCGTVTITESDVETAACGNTKTITRTWTATDECGNASTAVQTITVVDTTPPSITAPADITIECTDDESSANTGVATGSDTCGTVTITESDVETAACGNTKTITRTWTATDECGNASTAVQTITVVDTTPPSITAPADITIECTDDESSANTGVATGSDTCGTVTITESDVETAACGNTKTITRTWTATDECGNASTAVQTITVVDTTPPSITAPADITIECTDDESSANTGVATGSDTCGTVTITESDVETAACGNTKTITRTWTATDECGNASTAVQTITVVDTTPPSITAPADITIECTDDESSANTGVATGSDTCGTVTITESDVETAACGNTKTITRTWTATDECGNASTAVQTITVVDTTPPSITAPADITIECTDDESSANTGVATGSDTCGTVTITESDVETAACGNTKTITRTWTATDECGNASTAVQTITVVDTTPPSITAPADVTIECTDDESSANTGVATGSDTCGTVTITESDVETAACGNTKTITRTWTATDECGNASTAVQTITVVDTTPPSITAPADVTIECTDDESSANTGVATGSDTCGTVTITESDVETAACGNTKTITRTWTATDECGNASTAVQTITVVDTTPPSIDNSNTQNIEIECGVTDPNALQNWLDTNAGATASDTCGNVTWSNDYGSDTNVKCDDGAITVTFTATDDCGNSTSTTATYLIKDTIDPELTIPADITIECPDDSSPSNTGTATATDNCSPANVTFNDVITNGNCPSNYTITRTWTATDACGNSISENQIITVQDTTNPLITVVASDQTVECDGAGNLAQLQAWLDTNAGAMATESCSTITWTHNFTSLSDGCSETGSAIVTFTATDECGNSSSTSAKFEIEDNVAPTFTVPADITIECDQDSLDLALTGDVTNEGDSCSPNIDATYVDAEAAGQCANERVITRTWTLVDDCGNTTTQVQTITIVDTTAPTFTVPASLTIECDQDELDLAITGDVSDEADNCSTNLDATYVDAEAAGQCANERVITRTWTLVDDCGNTTTQVQTITIVDTTAPTFTVPASLTIECDQDELDLNITGDVSDEADNCSTNLDATYVDAEAAGQCANERVITRTWTLVDDCGNTTTQVQTITIVDTSAPTFTVPASLTIECDQDELDLNITGDVSDEADNCSTNLDATFVDAEAAGQCANERVITRTWSLVDDCGNTTTQVQTITIVDTTAPTFTVPASLTIECDQDELDLNITGDVSDEADNCSTNLDATYVDSEAAGQCANERVITRTWSLVDDCGNTTTQVQTITIVDTTAPTFTVPASLTIECDQDELDLNITGDVSDEADNCSTNLNATYVDAEAAGQCANERVITRTWSLVDDCGNTTTQVQTITIVDTTAPTFTVPASLTIECDQDELDLNITGDVSDEADNCSTNLDATYVDAEAVGQCANERVITRTWSLVDDCGNTTTQVQTITIVDTTAPELVTDLNRNITVDCDSIPSVPQLTFTDACSSDEAITVQFNESSTYSGNAQDYVITRNWTVTDECGNQSVITQAINVNVSNVSSLDTTVCITEDFDLDLFSLLNGVDDFDGTWTVVSGNATINGSIFNPSSLLDSEGRFEESDLGIYTFRYESLQNTACPTEVEVSITINDECVVFPCGAEDVVISKAVTPNGDNINDFFSVTGVEPCGFVIELQIFNRWGAKIYENFNYQNDWYGTSSKSSFGSSNTVPTGTYYYIINLKNSGLKPFAGPIYVGTK
ncbi:gliding motility-associated-like protein [Flavobacteriaceae bacterium MAR_2010_105]|nr:gliding motility-associated-like protein [Flavobacteriaceae bacterium MAR_2010_105]